MSKKAVIVVVEINEITSADNSAELCLQETCLSLASCSMIAASSKIESPPKPPDDCSDCDCGPVVDCDCDCGCIAAAAESAEVAAVEGGFRFLVALGGLDGTTTGCSDRGWDWDWD